MDPLETTISVVAGLFGGAVGGVLTAGKIARSSERARAQFDAEERVTAVVTIYRSTMVFDHEQVYEKSHYSEDYTSVADQEIFACDLLVLLPHLRSRSRETIKASLKALLGDLTYNLAVQRAFVPTDRVDDATEGQRRTLVLHQILNADNTRVDGILPSMLSTQNNGVHHLDLYGQALKSLDRMLAAVAARPAWWNLRRSRAAA